MDKGFDSIQSNLRAAFDGVVDLLQDAASDIIALAEEDSWGGEIHASEAVVAHSA